MRLSCRTMTGQRCEWNFSWWLVSQRAVQPCISVSFVAWLAHIGTAKHDDHRWSAWDSVIWYDLMSRCEAVLSHLGSSPGTVHSLIIYATTTPRQLVRACLVFDSGCWCQLWDSMSVHSVRSRLWRSNLSDWRSIFGTLAARHGRAVCLSTKLFSTFSWFHPNIKEHLQSPPEKELHMFLWMPLLIHIQFPTACAASKAKAFKPYSRQLW